MLQITAVPLVSAALSLIAIVVSLVVYFTQRGFSDTQRVQKLTERLYDFDKLLVQNPAPQEQLEKLRHVKLPYFYAPDRAHDADYVRLKSYVYMHLNFFDEIVLTIYDKGRIETVTEFDDWKTYIIARMRHPLFQEVFDRERSIWGDRFRKFVELYRDEIKKPVDDVIF